MYFHFIAIFFITFCGFLSKDVFAQNSAPLAQYAQYTQPGAQFTHVKQGTEDQNKIDLSKPSMPIFSVNIANGENPDDLTPALRALAILTLLTFGPALLLLSSAFTRILIVLSFLRQAI